MAKMTPADWKKEADKLKGIIAAAKKKPQNFGLVELKEGMALCAHGEHSITKLLAQAKKADGAKKANCVTGKFKLDGKKFVFDCQEEKLPGGMEIKFKQYLKKAEHGAWKAEFVLPTEGGNGAAGEAQVEGDGAPAPTQTEPEQVSDGPADVKEAEDAPEAAEKKDVLSKEELAANLKHMSEVFKLSFKNMSDEDAKELKAALKAIAAAIASGDLVSAQNMMNKLTMLTGVSGSSPMEPITYVSRSGGTGGKSGGGGDDAKRKKELKKSFDKLKPDLRDAVASAEGAEKAEIGKHVKGFDKNLKAGKLDEAEESLNALKEKLTGDGDDEDDSLIDELADGLEEIGDAIGKKVEKAKAEAKEGLKEFVEDVKETAEDVVTGVKDALGILSEEDEKRKATLEGLEVPEGRQMDLIKLARDNPKTYDSAVKALQSLEKTHGGIDVSPEGVSAAIKAATDARVANDAAAKASRAAKAERDKKKKELDDARAKEQEEKKKVADAQKALDDYKASLPDDLSTLSEADRKKAEDKIQELSGALKTASDALKVASDATAAAKTAHDAAAADYKTKRQAWVDAWDNVKKTEDAEAKLQEKKALLDALSFGPLSSNAKKPMDDATVAKFVDAFAKDPKTAATAVKLAGQVEDPTLIADNVGMLCDKVADGFADKKGNKVKASTEELQLMAENALKNGARLGPDYFKGLKTYLESGKQTEPDDCAPKGLKEGTPEFEKKLALNRTGKMADALIGEDGKVDPDSKEAKEAMEHMMFHPGSLKKPAPAMTDQMSGFMDDFRDKKKGPQMQAILDGIEEPKKCLSAHSLVSATIGEDGPADAKDIKKAVMSAMLTPLAQGPVGSCFSTGPARSVREQDPVKAMKDMTHIATTGMYKPAKGDPIPAVMSLPKGENPLMRSYEYSIATAGAELEDSRENSNLRKGLFNKASGETSLADLEDIVGSAKWKNEIEGKVQEAMEDGLVFRYNAGPKVGDGSGDGSSTHGRFEILDASTKKPILSDKEFQAVVGKIALEACGFEKTSDEGKAVLELVGKQAFLDTVMKAYNKEGASTKYAPWNMQSGGFARTSTEALRGGDPKSKSWMSEGDGKPENEGKRTKEVLSKFIAGTSGEKSEMISLSTNGRKDEGANHAFNGLPNHPSLDKIKPPNTDKKIQEELLEPGKAMAKTELPTAQAAAMYDEMVKDIVSSYRYEDRKTVADALNGKRPTDSMTPGELKKHVNDLLQDFKDNKLKEDMEAWEKKKKKELKVDTLPTDLVDKRRALLEKNIASKINKNVDKELIKNFDPPEVVIADTNWGGDDSHTYFVIAPDPASGELKMWRKDKFSGEMSPAGDNWVNSTWYELDGVPPVGS